MKNLMTALALVFILVQTSHSQTPSPTPYTYEQLKRGLTDYIRNEVLDKDNIRGLSIALVDGDQVVWAQGFGYSNPEKRTPATADTRYALGGVSRLFTAAEALHLSEQGRIGLDLPLQKYIRGFSIRSRFKKAKPITPRSLIAGHSGLPGFFLKGIWVDKPETLAGFVKELKNDYLYDLPQTHYRYSYTDYDLLGRLIELKRKKPFAEAMKENLLEPLGMDSSAFETPLPSEITARGYFDGNPALQARLRDIPAGGMVSSANDMARFIAFLLGAEAPGKAPLSEKGVAAMFRQQYPQLPLDFNHRVAMGWNLSGLVVEGVNDLAWCDGTYPGYFASIMVSREEGLGVVILSNSGEAGKVADELSARILKLALQVKKGNPAKLEKIKIVMPPVVEVPKETLEKYAGTYSALAQIAQIKPQEKNLGLEFDGHQLDLLPISQTTFVPHLVFILFPVDLPQYPLTFSTGGGKEVILLGGLRFPIPFERIAPVEIPRFWRERQGEYVLENADGQIDFSKISLTQKGDFLTVVMKVSLKALHIKDKEFKIALLPQSDEDAVVPGLFYGDGGTLHAVEDKEGNTRIYYSGYWFKKLRKEVSVTTRLPVLASPKPLAPKEAAEITPGPKKAVITPALTPAKPSSRPRL